MGRASTGSLLCLVLCAGAACPSDPPPDHPRPPAPVEPVPSTPAGAWGPGDAVSRPPSALRPHIPAVLPDLVLIEDGAYTRPTLPPHRTSSDGRVAINLNEPMLYLMSPESLSTPLASAAPGTVVAVEAQTLVAEALYDPQVYTDLGATDVIASHQTLCDPIVTTPGEVPQGTPSPCADDPTADCYALTVWSSVEFRAPDSARDTQLWAVPLAVRVAEAKTATAHIADWSLGEPVAGPVVYARSLREPMVTGDGRLLVLRVSKTHRDPNIGSPIDAPLDVVYATIPATAEPCDVGALGPLYPVSHAHHDPEVLGDLGPTHASRGLGGAPLNHAHHRVGGGALVRRSV